MDVKHIIVFIAFILAVGLYADSSEAFYVFCDSNSMYPAFDCNSKYKLERVDPYRDLKVGDIVVYVPRSYQRYMMPNVKTSYIIHRIIHIEGKYPLQYFVTKGDNNKFEDPFYVYPYQVKWRFLIK